MPVPNPDHLLEQAAKLVVPPPAGPPRQVDLRRAISSAYYAVFHHVLAAAADEFIGKTKRNSPHYTLAYRSIDHRNLRSLCEEFGKPTPPAKYLKYLPPNAMGPNIREFCTALVDLQEKRHSADYDPSMRFKTSDALISIATARSAIRRFQRASSIRRKAFLAMLLFRVR